MKQNSLNRLLNTVHDTYLQLREAQAARRLRACRARLPDQPMPRKARRVVMPVQAEALKPVASSASPIKKTRLPRAPRRSARDFSMAVPSAADVLKKAETCSDLVRNDWGQFSSPELTAWYILQVMGANHYVR